MSKQSLVNSSFIKQPDTGKPSGKHNITLAEPNFFESITHKNKQMIMDKLSFGN